METICVAVCKPGNTYAGNPDPQYPAGRSPHTCSTLDARGSFTTATTTTNGEHCVYSWFFEFDQQSNFVRSPTSDTVGICIDHTKYKYDSNGDGMVDRADANWPLCASLPKLGSGSGSNRIWGADDFGCIDSTSAGFPFTGKHVGIELRLAQ